MKSNLEKKNQMCLLLKLLLLMFGCCETAKTKHPVRSKRHKLSVSAEVSEVSSVDERDSGPA